MSKQTMVGVEQAGKIAGRLSCSQNVRDQRRGRDLQELVDLVRGRWVGRFEILGFGGTQDRSLVVVCSMEVNGLKWEGERTVPHSSWTFALEIPETYPLSAPPVRFLNTVPFCPHVVHADFLPALSGLPAYLASYIRLGQGHCCYIRSSQWNPDVSRGNLATVCWQVSRIVSLAKMWGEAGSLNPSARDYAFRLAGEGRVPLGPPLPYPAGGGGGPPEPAIVVQANQDTDSEDIEWVDQ